MITTASITILAIAVAYLAWQQHRNLRRFTDLFLAVTLTSKILKIIVEEKDEPSE